MRMIFTRAVLISLVLIILGSCSQLPNIIKSLRVEFASFSIDSDDGTRTRLISKMAVTNPSDLILTVNKVDYVMALNGRNIFAGSMKSTYTIQPRATIVIDVPVTLSPQESDVFINALRSGTVISYEVSGTLDTNLINMPFSHQRNIFMPEVMIKDFRVNAASLSALDMSLDVSVVNKNNFLLPLTGLSYTVTTAGITLLKSHIKQNGVERNSRVALSVPVRVNPSNVINSRLQLLDNPYMTIDVDAVLEFGFINLSFDITKTINLKEYIDGH